MYVRAGQTVQVAAPDDVDVIGPYWPATHAVPRHVVDPGVMLYLPLPQGMHWPSVGLVAPYLP